MENHSTAVALQTCWDLEDALGDRAPRPRLHAAFHVLVLDEHPQGVWAMRRILEPHALVSSARTAAQALTLVDRAPVDAVICALDLEGSRDGAWLLGRIARHWPATRRILVASAVDDRVSLALARGHAQNLVLRPVTRRALMNALACARRSLVDALPPLARVLLGGATCKSKSS